MNDINKVLDERIRDRELEERNQLRKDRISAALSGKYKEKLWEMYCFKKFGLYYYPLAKTQWWKNFKFLAKRIRHVEKDDGYAGSKDSGNDIHGDSNYADKGRDL
jgi:hypothetical protein